MRDLGWAPVELDTTRPHPARMYDYYLGGKDNYPVDWAAAEEVLRVAPEARLMARENRAFLQRAVGFVVREAGIRQIIDVGTGIPTAGNVHEVAQAVAPNTHVVYADNDPIVHVHANALLAGAGPTGVLLADLRRPEEVLAHPTVERLIDFTRPVALLLIAILHFIRDDEDPAAIVRTLLDALPAGSYLVLSHATADLRAETASQVAETYTAATSTLTLRSHAEISTFFDGCELVSPGLVQVPLWRREDTPPEGHDRVWLYGGVGRKRGA